MPTYRENLGEKLKATLRASELRRFLGSFSPASPIDDPIYSRILRTLQARNTIKVVGSHIYMPTTGMVGELNLRNLKTAVDVLRGNGTREFYEFAPQKDPSSGRFALPATRPTSGYYSQNFLEDISLRWAEEMGEGARVTVTSFSQGRGNKAVESIIKRGQGLAIERDANKVLQLWNPNNTQATTRQIVEFLGRHGTRFGLNKDGAIADFGAWSKRMGGLLSPQGTSTFTPNKLIRTAVFDPARAFNYGGGRVTPMNIQGAHAMGVANDAAIQVSSNFVRKQADQLKREAARLRHEGNPKAADDLMMRVGDLYKMAKTGKGSLYIQAYGLNIRGVAGADISGLTAGLRAGEGYSTKGIATINNQLANRYNADIVMAQNNIKKEIITTYSKVNLDPRKAGHVVFMDEQTLTSHPKLLGLDNITDFNLKSAKQLVNDLMAGKVPVKITNAIESALQREIEKGNLSIEGFVDIDNSKRFLAELHLLNTAGIVPKNLPAFAETMIKQYSKHIASKGMEVPDALRAYMVSDMLNSEKGRVAGVRRGTARFDPNNGRWVFNRNEMGKIAAILGGGDSDDAINMYLRWDETAKRMQGIATRNPNALGELVVFNLDEDDNAIYHSLLHKDPEKARQFKELFMLDELKKLDNFPNAKAARLAQRNAFLAQNFTHIEDSSALFQLNAEWTEELVQDTVTGKWKVEGKYVTNVGGNYGKIISFMDSNVDVESVDVMNLNDFAKRYAGDVAKNMQLGTHQNMAMVLNGFLDSLAAEHIDFLHDAIRNGNFAGFQILREESLIDLLTKGGKLTADGLPVELQKHIKELYELIGEASALLAQGFDGFTSLDPALLESRGSFGMESIRAGIRKVAGSRMSLGDVQMQSGDQRAFFGQFESARKEIGGFLERLAEQELYPNLTYPEAVIDPRTYAAIGRNSEVRAAAKRIMGSWIEDIKSLAPDKTEAELVELMQTLSNMGATGNAVAQAKWERANLLTEARIAEFSTDPRIQNQVWIAMMQEASKKENTLAYKALFFGDKRTLATVRAVAEAHLLRGDLFPGTAEYDKYLKMSKQEILYEALPSANAEKIAYETIEEAVSPVRRVVQRLIDRDELAKAWSKPLFRGGSFAVAGLLALGVVRSITHQPPTPEQYGGPETQPGGNPYDTYAAGNNYYGQASGGATLNSGVRYVINARGEYERSEIQSQMMAIDSSFDMHGGTTYSLPSVTSSEKERRRLLSGF